MAVIITPAAPIRPHRGSRVDARLASRNLPGQHRLYTLTLTCCGASVVASSRWAGAISRNLPRRHQCAGV